LQIIFSEILTKTDGCRLEISTAFTQGSLACIRKFFIDRIWFKDFMATLAMMYLKTTSSEESGASAAFRFSAYT